MCKLAAQAPSSCFLDSLCSYSIYYGDGSSSSGYYVSDMFHFDTFIGNSATTNFSSNIIFGCSNSESGLISKQKRALDGILGLGHHPISIISQLASRGVTKVFWHCMKGDEKGGGILIFGEIIVPGIIYSPLVPSQPYYNLNLLSISISGRTVPIDPKVFSTSRNRRGTIVDSGTTFVFLIEEAYDPFVTALVAAIPPSVSSYSEQGNQYFLVSNRDVFPLVSLNFAGGASMVLRPEEYLIQQLSFDDGAWCIGFQKSQGITILGELVLKDKIIVYDLARQRLGWADYNCSSFVNASSASPGKHVSSSSQDAILYPLIPIAIAGFFVYFSISAGFLFL